MINVKHRRDYNKRPNTHIPQGPEGKEKEGRTGEIPEEGMAESFPNVPKDINLHVQEGE